MGLVLNSKIVKPSKKILRGVYLPWTAPRAFTGFPGSISSELEDFIVVSEVQTSDRISLVEAERLGVLVARYWGNTGTSVLRFFLSSVEKFAGDHSALSAVQTRITTVEGDVEMVVTQDGILLVSVGIDLTLPGNCIEWIDGVLGSPSSVGLWRKRHSLSALVKGYADVRKEHDMISKAVGQDLIDAPIYWVEYGLPREEKIGTTSEPYSLCWAELFDRAYVGWCESPHHSTLTKGRGLRISFELMLALSGIVEHKEHNGGVILVGLFTVLIPMAFVDEGIQWHLKTYESGSRLRIIQDDEDFSALIPAGRLLVKDVNLLTGMAYVGWGTEVNINLLNGQLPLPGRSSLQTKSSTRWQLKQRAGQLGFQGPSPFQLQVSGQLIYERYSTVCRYGRGQSFGLTIDAIFRAIVFIFDESRKTMWLCPASHLIVFMLRHYLKANHYKPVDADILTIGEPGEASRKLKRLEHRIIETGLTQTYGEVIMNIINRYSAAFGKLSRVEGGNELLGYELLDILGNESYFNASALKCEPSVRCWSPLVGKEDIIFCHGIGEVMSRQGVGNSECDRPPEGCNLLVTPVALLERRLEKICHEGYKWAIRGSPFCCPSSETKSQCAGLCWKERIQEIVRKDNVAGKVAKLFGVSKRSPETKIAPLPPMGALCFGSVNAVVAR